MTHLLRPTWPMVLLLSFFTLFAAGPRPAMAAKFIKAKNFEGAVNFSEDGPSTFALKGKAKDLGRFVAYGEVTFLPGEEEGSFFGAGVAVFKDKNGDLLVGTVTWTIDGGDGEFSDSKIQFHWTDSVEFSNGIVVSNTGRFIEERPQGLVVIAIIAILIGLLLP